MISSYFLKISLITGYVLTQLFLFVEIFPGVKQDVESLSVLGQPLNNKCPDISEFEGKQIAVEICKFAKSNLVQVNIKLAYFAGIALNSIGVLDIASSPILKRCPNILDFLSSRNT